MAPDRSIDRSIPSFDHEATTEPKAAFWTGSVSLSPSIGHINHIANDAALLFIYSLSLSLSSSAFSYEISVSRLRPSSIFRRKFAATPSSAESSLSLDHAIPRKRLVLSSDEKR